MALLCT